jgi:hypothetical protein
VQPEPAPQTQSLTGWRRKRCTPGPPTGYARGMHDNRVREHEDGVREVIEVHRPEGCGGITFEWHIKLVPHDSDEGYALRTAQARAIRGLLEWLRDQPSP